MPRTKRHGQGGEIPVEQPHLTLVAVGAGIQHDGRTLRIDDEVAVEAHPVVKQLFVQPDVVLHTVRLVGRPNAVKICQDRIHHPQDSATVHQELIEDDLVLVGKHGIRLRHHSKS